MSAIESAAESVPVPQEQIPRFARDDSGLRAVRVGARFTWPVPIRLVLLAVLLVVALVAAVRLGAVSLTTRALLEALAGHGDPSTVTIIRELRLPRALQAALVGAALAVSGATFQALLRNPLAEPYILGVSSGAATGAVATVVTVPADLMSRPGPNIGEAARVLRSAFYADFAKP